jgi:hypothetical protein
MWRDLTNNQIPPANKRKKYTHKKKYLNITHQDNPPAAATAAFTAFPRRRQPPPAVATASTRSP